MRLNWNRVKPQGGNLFVHVRIVWLNALTILIVQNVHYPLIWTGLNLIQTLGDQMQQLKFCGLNCD